MILADMKEMLFSRASGSVLFVTIGSWWGVIACYLLAVNLVAFFMMWSDKRRAKREGASRIPEKSLFLSALLGGSIGAIAGMQIFRHKTKHRYFVVGMPVILILQAAAALWLIMR